MEILYLMSCDEWKSHSSMRLIMITTDERVLYYKILDEIKKGNMEYDGDFEEDWATSNIADINMKLTYGFYNYTFDGENI